MNHHPAASTGYQWGLTALLSLNFGFVLFDRNALSFLMPFVQPDLALNNSQIGLLAGGLSFTWAIAAFGVGLLADRRGSRKTLLIAATVLFALCSFWSGMATGFLTLMLSRLAMGLAEGGIMPVSQSLIAAQVDARRRGLAMGITQGFGSSLMGSFVAPVLLVAVAEHLGWRSSFFLAGAPGLLLAVLMFWIIRDTATSAPSAAATRAPLDWRALLANPNILRCLLVSIAFVGYLVVTWTFMPLYLVQQLHYDNTAMSWLMGTLGVAATLFSFLLTGLSDRIGRRPVIIATAALAFILPLSCMVLHGPAWLLGIAFFSGWAFTGAMPLFMATVPSESVSAGQMGAALGLCMGGSEILGGVLAPVISGVAADHLGPAAPLWCLAVLASIGLAASSGLQETAPTLLR